MTNKTASYVAIVLLLWFVFVPGEGFDYFNSNQHINRKKSTADCVCVTVGVGAATDVDFTKVCSQTQHTCHSDFASPKPLKRRKEKSSVCQEQKITSIKLLWLIFLQLHHTHS